MNVPQILTVYAKELRDALRDRRTVVSMIVVPTLMIPGIMLMAVLVTARIVRRAAAEAPAVMVLGGTDSPAVRAALAADTKLRIVPAAGDWRQRIIDKQVRAAVEVPAGFDAKLAAGRSAEVTIYNYENELRSGMAVAELRRFFTDFRDRQIAARLAARGLPADFVRPFEVKQQNVAPPEKVGGNAVGGFIPYLFLILCFTGAMYPAMDLTAGEKERGTMETILCSPLGRTELVLGKFLVVLTASLATVVCSLASLALTSTVGRAVLGGAGLPGAGARSLTLDPLGVVAVLGMVLPIAVLFSAVLMAIALHARTVKEASSYVSPLVMVIILPAVMALLPGFELNTRLALVPILNVSLACKDLVSGVFHWPHLALIFGSTCLYAAAALAWCVRLFNRESVIFRS